MSPTSAVVSWTNIAPGQGVQARRDVRVICIRTVGVNNLLADSTNVVDRYQDGNDDKGDWDEQDQERLEVSKEEIGIETAFFDDFTVVVSEHGGQ